MNIKEFINIFDDDVCEKILNIEDYGVIPVNFMMKIKTTSIEPEVWIRFCNNEMIELELCGYENEGNSIKWDTLKLIYKIKTQWENNYLNESNETVAAFDKQMEKEEIFEKIDKMCEVTE